jgi:alpha-ketoglutarate-dependent taurine dioxygenase
VIAGPIGRARRQPVLASPEDWVRPTGVERLPYEVGPTTDVDLADWSCRHAAVVDRWLHRWGAVLFTGFRVGLASFGTVAGALTGSALPYRERSSPRTQLAPGVYTSTDYPADQPIPLHNENSYQLGFPARLAFCCTEPPGEGGATPLADCRRVLDRIPPAVVAAFRDKGVRYVRTYTEGLGLPWREAFQSDTRRGVEDYCAGQDIAVRWLESDGLRTEQVRPAVEVHPVTGEEVWFNHAAFFHPSSLPPAVHDALVARHGQDGLPTTVTYGDGSPIDPAALSAIRDAYAAETVAVPWRRGDVLLVDNLLAAHGRQPFTGARTVIVSMGGLITRDQPNQLHRSTG